MKIEVNIDKKHFIIIVSLIAILGVVLVTNAYNDPEDPSVIGHHWNDIGGIPSGFADGVDNVDDADADPNNEIQNLNSVLGQGNDAGRNNIINLEHPDNNRDAATKYYVDSSVGKVSEGLYGWCKMRIVECDPRAPAYCGGSPVAECQCPSGYEKMLMGEVSDSGARYYSCYKN